MNKGIICFQLGKNSLNGNFLETLRKSFKNREIVKVSVLQSCSRNRQEIKEIAENIIKNLGENFTHKIIGFTIIIRKWRKPRKPKQEKK